MRTKKIWAVLIIGFGVLSAINGIVVYQADSTPGKESAFGDEALSPSAVEPATASPIQEEILSHSDASVDREKAQRILFLLLGVLCSLIGTLMILDNKREKLQPLLVPYPKDMNTRLYPRDMEPMDGKFTL